MCRAKLPEPQYICQPVLIISACATLYTSKTKPADYSADPTSVLYYLYTRGYSAILLICKRQTED